MRRLLTRVPLVVLVLFCITPISFVYSQSHNEKKELYMYIPVVTWKLEYYEQMGMFLDFYFNFSIYNPTSLNISYRSANSCLFTVNISINDVMPYDPMDFLCAAMPFSIVFPPGVTEINYSMPYSVGLQDFFGYYSEDEIPPAGNYRFEILNISRNQEITFHHYPTLLDVSYRNNNPLYKFTYFYWNGSYQEIIGEDNTPSYTHLFEIPILILTFSVCFVFGIMLGKYTKQGFKI